MGISYERSCVWFPANHGSIRKGTRPQMLLYHTSMQVRKTALILETKKYRVTRRFLTEYHRVSRQSYLGVFVCLDRSCIHTGFSYHRIIQICLIFDVIISEYNRTVYHHHSGFTLKQRNKIRYSYCFSQEICSFSLLQSLNCSTSMKRLLFFQLISRTGKAFHSV